MAKRARQEKVARAEPEQPAGPTPNDYLAFKTEEAKAKAAQAEAKRPLAALAKKRKALKIDQRADRLSYELQDPELLIRARRYAAWRGAPIPIQDDLLEQVDRPTEKAATEFNEAQVTMDGQNAGAKGLPREGNPHPLGSVHHALWDRSWLAGQAQIADEMVRPADQSRARREPKRRGEDAEEPRPTFN
jgi:hypothetical protein